MNKKKIENLDHLLKKQIFWEAAISHIFPDPHGGPGKFPPQWPGTWLLAQQNCWRSALRHIQQLSWWPAQAVWEVAGPVPRFQTLSFRIATQKITDMGYKKSCQDDLQVLVQVAAGDLDHFVKKVFLTANVSSIEKSFLGGGRSKNHTKGTTARKHDLTQCLISKTLNGIDNPHSLQQIATWGLCHCEWHQVCKFILTQGMPKKGKARGDG